MDQDTRHYMQQGFDNINKRLDEGAQRFTRVEKKLDERETEHMRLQSEMARLRGDHEALHIQVRLQDGAIESAMTIIDRMEQRDRDRQTRDDQRHQENLLRMGHLTQKVDELVKKPTPGTTFLAPDSPITTRILLWAVGLVIAGGNGILWWLTLTGKLR